MSQPENPYAGQGAVLLDIGDGVGALVVTMPSASDGLEVEIRPSGHHHEQPTAHHHEGWPTGSGHARHHQHVAVVARPGPNGPVHSLVYPGMEAGDYDLVPIPGDHVALTAHVVGGTVTQLAWPTTWTS